MWKYTQKKYDKYVKKKVTGKKITKNPKTIYYIGIKTTFKNILKKDKNAKYIRV